MYNLIDYSNFLFITTSDECILTIVRSAFKQVVLLGGWRSIVAYIIMYRVSLCRGSFP